MLSLSDQIRPTSGGLLINSRNHEINFQPFPAPLLIMLFLNMMMMMIMMIMVIIIVVVVVFVRSSQFYPDVFRQKFYVIFCFPYTCNYITSFCLNRIYLRSHSLSVQHTWPKSTLRQGICMTDLKYVTPLGAEKKKKNYLTHANKIFTNRMRCL